MKNITIKGLKISSVITCFLVASMVLVSCNDLLSVDSKRLTTDTQYDLNAPGDSVYSMFGVLSRLQKLADSYVLLGELRAELLNVTATSDTYLREINDFNISSDNIYVNIKDYYAVINNCNYIIQKLDTGVVDKGQKLKLREYATVKAIRAWTYMQVALNFKTAKYYDKPILTVADAEKIVPEYTIEQLANILIDDLKPLKDVSYPNLGSIDSYNTSMSYFPVNFVLGDLYLWRGSLTGNTSDYESAATAYHQLMYDNHIVIDKANTSYWVPVNNTISNDAYINWLNAFSLSTNEVITTITCPTDYGQNFYLDSLNNQSKIAPSSISISNWMKQTYYLNEDSNSQGDLRMYGSIWFKEFSTKPISNNSYTVENGYNFYIYKYKLYKQNVIVYRSSLLYLRYAEAVNRLHKPKLAFAVLKYGLNSTNLFNEKIVPAKEKTTPLQTYMSFTDSRFINNVGIRMRGLGNIDKDTTFYTIPKMAGMTDSVLYVEDMIQQELSLETAYEGNRFQDLMRITLRRIQNGEGTEAYLANKVAEKHTDNKEAIRTKLLNSNNWYILPK